MYQNRIAEIFDARLFVKMGANFEDDISAQHRNLWRSQYVRLTSTSYSPRRTVPLETDKSDFLGIVMISFKYRPMCKAVNNSLIEL